MRFEPRRMDLKLLRLVYVFEFLAALIAVFTLWSQVGGQAHLDLMAWYFKLGLGVGIAYATVRATRAAVEGERAWNLGSLRWTGILVALAIAAGAITYYYHVYEPSDEDQDEPATQTSIEPARLSVLSARTACAAAWIVVRLEGGIARRRSGEPAARADAVPVIKTRPECLRMPHACLHAPKSRHDAHLLYRIQAEILFEECQLAGVRPEHAQFDFDDVGDVHIFAG